MRVKIVKCNNPLFWYADRVGQDFEAEEYDDTSYVVVNLGLPDSHLILKAHCEIIEEPTPYIQTSQIIDFNGIQTEPFTLEQKKVIAVEKDVIKLGLFNNMLETFKTANELQRIALLEIFEEMGYPQTDMVKLYRHFQNEL